MFKREKQLISDVTETVADAAEVAKQGINTTLVVAGAAIVIAVIAIVVVLVHVA